MDRLLRLRATGLRAYLLERGYMRVLRRRALVRRFGHVNYFGRNLPIDRRDLEQVYLEADCVREPENLFIFRALAQRGVSKTFIDIGANYGHIALKVYPYFRRLILVDANPNAVAFLQALFSGKSNVEILHRAVVDEGKAGTATLAVPRESSGLARVVEAAPENQSSFECPAVTLRAIFQDVADDAALIKIDVEGFEKQVLKGGRAIIDGRDTIICFEAWSRRAAEECCQLFGRHVFYFARFDLLDRTGKLSSSWPGVFRALLMGGGISIYRFESIASVPFEHFSQIIAVPTTVRDQFERALYAERDASFGTINLGEAFEA